MPDHSKAERVVAVDDGLGCARLGKPTEEHVAEVEAMLVVAVTAVWI
jgi:hypothetical protein